MAKLFVKKGATSKLVHIFIQDSSKTDGSGLTGLTSGSTGLVCYRARQDDGNAGATQLALSAGTRGTWSSGGFVEKDSTNMPGIYELGLDNAGLATGVNDVLYMLKGATNMAPLPLEIQLVDFDPQDAVHLGLSALPNTAVTTNASLITSGTGTDQLSVSSGRAKITSNVLKNSAGRIGFTMTDSTTHNPKTGLTVASTVSIDGGAFGATVNSVVEIANGDYTLALAAADTNGNDLIFRFTATGADDLNIEVVTQP